MNKFIKTLYKLWPVFYYDVPKCPQCGKIITGRYVKTQNPSNTDWMITQSLKHGEIIVPVPELAEHNLVCFTCNHTWYESVPLRVISKYRQEEEKTKRCTREILRERYEQKRENGELEKKGNFLTRYIGHI